jgi:hypothetical protein
MSALDDAKEQARRWINEHEEALLARERHLQPYAQTMERPIETGRVLLAFIDGLLESEDERRKKQTKPATWSDLVNAVGGLRLWAEWFGSAADGTDEDRKRTTKHEEQVWHDRVLDVASRLPEGAVRIGVNDQIWQGFHAAITAAMQAAFERGMSTRDGIIQEERDRCARHEEMALSAVLAHAAIICGARTAMDPVAAPSEGTPQDDRAAVDEALMDLRR